MSGFKGSDPFTLVVVIVGVLLGAAIIFGFYVLNVARIVQSTYNIQYSTDLNSMGTEIVNILEHQRDGIYNIDLLARDITLNYADYMESTVDDTLKALYDGEGINYDLMVDYGLGFLFRYGDSKQDTACGIEAPRTFFDESGNAMFTLEWPFRKEEIDPSLVGEVTSLQGPRYIFDHCNCHSGMDFRCSEGDAILAVYAGEIEHAGWHERSVDDHSQGYGKMVRIKHWIGAENREDVPPGEEPDFYTYYGHLDSIPDYLEPGDWVNTGQEIGSCGNTGRSTGPHLHLELRDNMKRFTNICPFLREQPFECRLFTERKPTFCGDYSKVDVPVVFDIPVPGAILSNGRFRTKATGVLYVWK